MTPAAGKRTCQNDFAAARLRKAERFMQAADIVHEFDDERELCDSIVTLYIHSGIASSDVICCQRLGEYHSGENHSGAVTLLRRVDNELAEQLSRLLRTKTKAAYSGAPASAGEVKLAQRAANKLVEAAQQYSKS